MSESQQRRMGGQPLFVLSEDSSRTSGRDARQANISAGKAIAEAVRTTLGPRGMDKMLVSDSGDVVITNDGATILDEMDIEHPAAEMIVEVSDTQQEEIGDGTTTAAILTGRLLAGAEDLFEDDVHPTTIVEGYHRAAEFARDAIDEIALDSAVDEDVLRTVAESSMTGKGTGGVTTERLADVVVRAVQQVRDGNEVNRENVTVHTQAGASSAASELIEGIVLDEEPEHAQMPASVEDASVAVLDVELGVRSGDVDAEYAVESVDQLTAAMESEEQELLEVAEKIEASGVDVVFSTESVDDRVAAQLARRGILAFNIVNNDASPVANATGATRVGDLDDLEDDDFGHVDAVRTETFEDDDLVFIEGGEAARAVTVFCRGGTEHVVDEVERAITDALDVVTAAVETGSVVPGAGAAEIAIADHVREEAASVEGRKQLAVDAFADAIDAIPRTLAENAGADPIDALVDLRAAHEETGRAGLIAEGQSAEVGDPVEHGVLDPAAVKEEAVESATEAATMIVRIDDVIAAN